MKWFHNIGTFAIVFIVLYAVKLPLVNFDLYKIIYPGLAIFIFICLYSTRNEDIYFGRYVVKTYVCWILIAVWGFMQALFYNTLENSVSYILYDICIACVTICWAYWAGLEGKKKTILMFFWLFSSAVAVSGFYEAFTGNFYHLTHISYLYTKNMFGLYRPNTIFYNINDSATFMFFALVNGFLYAEETKCGKLIRVISLALFGGNILFTDSRGAALGMALFLALYLITNIEIKNKIVYFIIFLPVLLFGIAFAVEILVGNIGEGTGRTEIWAMSWGNLKRSWFMGVGPGNIAAINVQRGMTLITAVHNFALEMFCDYGIIGIILLLDWYVSVFRYSFLHRKQFGSATLCYAALVAFLPVSISSSSLINKSWMIPFFAIIVISVNEIERNSVYKERIKVR